ncbi:MAG: hypothetical protein ACRCUY_01065 [Thermoguttaceae bacterium]
MEKILFLFASVHGDSRFFINFHKYSNKTTDLRRRLAFVGGVPKKKAHISNKHGDNHLT